MITVPLYPFQTLDPFKIQPDGCVVSLCFDVIQKSKNMALLLLSGSQKFFKNIEEK